MSCYYSPVTAHLPQQHLLLLLKTKRSYLLSPGQIFYYLNHTCPEKIMNKKKQDITTHGKSLNIAYFFHIVNFQLPD